MSDTTHSIITVIIVAVLVLLFFGFLFLVMLMYYNNKKIQVAREKKAMQELFEKQLLESRLEIQEQTFNQISQEIHDNVGQTLSLAKVQTNILDQTGTLDRTILGELKVGIGNALTDLRDIARSLNNERIQVLGLPALIGEELQRIEKTKLIHTQLDVEGEERALATQEKLIIFRMVQESLQNILKHAKASEVRVHVKYAPEQVDITIQDNGVGFDAEAQREKGRGIGLQNIRSRASMIRGQATIDSMPEQGTKIGIRIPYS